MRKHNLPILIKMINELLAGNKSTQEVLDKWPKTKDDILNQAYGLIGHYRDDGDLKSKDPRYADWQRKQLEECKKEI